MLGKSVFKKVGKWVGKAHHTLESGNNWLGKALSSVKNEYRDIKRELLDNSGFFKPLALELFTDLETSPIGNIVQDVFRQAELRQEQLSDVLKTTNAVVKTGDRIGTLLTSGSKGGGGGNKNTYITRVSRFITS